MPGHTIHHVKARIGPVGALVERAGSQDALRFSHGCGEIPARRDKARVDVTVFDLDRTLTRSGTYSPFLLYVAGREAPWRLAFVPLVLVAMLVYKLRLLKRKRLKEIMHRLMLGKRIPASRAERHAGAFADRQFHSNCYAEGRRLVVREMAEGRVIILATAAPRLVAEAIASRLGIEHVVATEGEWDAGMLLSRIRGENCYGIEKLRKLQEFLAHAGYRRHDVAVRFYSDDISDRPIFDWSNEPIAVNPSAKLQRTAEARGWIILDWRGGRRWRHHTELRKGAASTLVHRAL